MRATIPARNTRSRLRVTTQKRCASLSASCEMRALIRSWWAAWPVRSCSTWIRPCTSSCSPLRRPARRSTSRSDPLFYDHVDRLGVRVEQDLRLATLDLTEHLRDLGVERHVPLAILRAFAEHEGFD